jgi:hypothetical protein
MVELDLHSTIRLQDTVVINSDLPGFVSDPRPHLLRGLAILHFVHAFSFCRIPSA